MDIIKQISILLWLLAAVLIAPPVLRHFGLTPKAAIEKLLVLTPSAPSASGPAATGLPGKQIAEHIPDEQNLFTEPASAAIAKNPKEYKSQDEKEFTEMIAGLERIGKIISAPSDKIPQLPATFVVPQDAAQKARWLPPPPGFMTAETFNYLIYREANPVSATLQQVLENIHGNLMLDLSPFTVVVKPNRILVMLFGKKESYLNYTNRPPWSGAASDLKTDTMYILEGDGFYPLSVHELTHLYFDGYFLPSVSPLWLSEGMAVYMQVQASKQKPSWIDASMQKVLSGTYIPLDQMTSMDSLATLSTDQAEIWYAQAYSVVAYLLTQRSRDEFYTLCNELKKGTPLYQALYRAYGMPFNKVSVLENVWLHDLRKAGAAQTPLPVKDAYAGGY